MRENGKMTRMQKYNYARELLNKHNIKTIDDCLAINNYGDIVFNSKQLANTITIRPQATKRTIKARIDMEIEIAKNGINYTQKKQ